MLQLHLLKFNRRIQFLGKAYLMMPYTQQMWAMLYAMAILRLVNCVVEKTRKKTEISIAEAAAAIGIPRTLIDIRHESSHHDLPSLTLVRDSAVKAIDWLKSYYWEPEMELIPYQRNGIAGIRKEIKSKLQQLASSSECGVLSFSVSLIWCFIISKFHI